jgi:hypothetical protein
MCPPAHSTCCCLRRAATVVLQDIALVRIRTCWPAPLMPQTMVACGASSVQGSSLLTSNRRPPNACVLHARSCCCAQALRGYARCCPSCGGMHPRGSKQQAQSQQPAFQAAATPRVVLLHLRASSQHQCCPSYARWSHGAPSVRMCSPLSRQTLIQTRKSPPVHDAASRLWVADGHACGGRDAGSCEGSSRGCAMACVASAPLVQPRADEVAEAGRIRGRRGVEGSGA